MKDAYTKEIVRKACLRDGKSQSKVARELGISRNTVRKLLKNPDLPTYQLKKTKQCPVSGPYLQIIETWLRLDERAPRKQRHTAQRIYNRLKSEYNYPGGVSRIRQIVAKLRKKPKEVFLPLEFQPGEMAQMDWGDVVVKLAGNTRKLQLFAITLNYSGDHYFEVFEHANQESFFQGHINSFIFFGGVPYNITYDNLSNAVTKILKGSQRQENKNFTEFRCTWLLNSRFCQPARGNGKGRIENKIKYAKWNLFTPVPEFENIVKLNKFLRTQCLAYRNKIQARQSQSIGERYLQEVPFLIPLPEFSMEYFRTVSTKTNKYSLIQFETNKYSVPSEYAYLPLWLKVFVNRVEITDGKKILAVHTRLKGREQESICFEHYQKVLERKPGAHRHFKGIKRAASQ